VVKVKPNCDNITIRFNEIYNSGRAYNGGNPNGEDNSEGIDNVNGDNMVVQNNYIHNICSNAIYAKGGAINALIENNWIENAYGAGVMVGFDTSPEFFDLNVNPQYYENIAGIVRNNLIMHTGWEGIGFYASKDAQVYNNTLVDVNYAQNYHSPIYFGISMQDWESYAGRPASVNPNVHHNIVCQPATFTKRPLIEIRYANEAQIGPLFALAGNPTMSNNCYYIAGRTAAFTDNRPGSLLQNAGFAAWQTHISGDSGSLEVDPALNDDYMPTNPLCYGWGYSMQPTSMPTYLAAVSPAAHTYPNAVAGYTNASMGQTFTITNAGNQPLTNLTAALGGPDFEISAPLSASSLPVLGGAAIGIRPKNGLAAGSYSDTLTIHWANDGGAGLAVNLSFTVNTSGQTIYNIADFYNTSGRLSLKSGDIIIVGARKYRVLPNEYNMDYWSQNSLETAISWWTDYLSSYVASGVLEEITGADPDPDPKDTITINFPGLNGVTIQYYTNVCGWQTVGVFNEACNFEIPQGHKATFGDTTVRVQKGGVSHTFGGLKPGAGPLVLNAPIKTIAVLGIAAACDLAIVQDNWVYPYAPAAVGAANEYKVFDNGKKYEVRLYRPGFYPITIPGVNAGQTVNFGAAYFYQVQIPAGVTDVWVSSYDWAVRGAKAGDTIVLLTDPSNIRDAKMRYTYKGITYNADIKLNGSNPFDSRL
jgi:hypothetical protein